MKATFFAASYSIAAVLAAPLQDRSDYAVHSSHYVPNGWTRVEKAQANQRLKLRIGLKQGSFQGLEKDLLEISDPNHYRYGKHLSSSEIHAHTAPSSEALNAVHQWLEEHDILEDQLEYSEPKVRKKSTASSSFLDIPLSLRSPL
jgi:tripeptidyl-peptidase-1